jgi:type I restriction enzyme R subunit
MTPEEKARQQIDAQLAASGWAVQTKDKINLSAARGVAVCELSFATGEPDYTLFVDGKAIGKVEAKPEGNTLSVVKQLESVVCRPISGERCGCGNPSCQKPSPENF